MGTALAAARARMSASTAWRALTPNIGAPPVSTSQCVPRRVAAFARGGRVTKTIVPLVRDRLRQMQASHPVLVRRVDVDDLRQPRLLEQAGGDARPVPNPAMHGHGRIFR